MAAMIKMACARCGGSGKFSYNLIHGNKCYGCMGSGYVLRDAEKEAERVARNAKNKAARAATAARRVELANSFMAQFAEEFGIPMTEGAAAMKSAYDIEMAVRAKYGCTIADFVNDAL